MYVRVAMVAIGSQQLPSGRHGFSRSYVARNQRERIVAAIAECSRETGYARMSVEDIVRRAGVSRRTFYEQFSSKEDAFLQAFDEVASLFVATVRKAVLEEDTFAGKIVAGFGTFLELLAISPAFANMCIVEVMAAGPAAIARRAEVMREFAELIEVNAALLPRTAHVPAITPHAIVGGIYEAAFQRIAAGQAESLPEMLPDVVEICALPYLGEARARSVHAALRARRNEAVEVIAAELAQQRSA